MIAFLPPAKYVCTVVCPFAKLSKKCRSTEQLRTDTSRRGWTRHLARQGTFPVGLVMPSGATQKSDQLIKQHQYFGLAGWVCLRSMPLLNSTPVRWIGATKLSQNIAFGLRRTGHFTEKNAVTGDIFYNLCPFV